MPGILRPLFLLSLFFIAAHGETHVNASLPYNNVIPHACYMKDAEKALDFNAFEKMEKRAVCGLDGGAAGFNFSSSAYWFYFDVNNSETGVLKRLLAFEPTWLDQIDVEVTSPSGAKQYYRGGDRYPFSDRTFKHPRTIFEIDLQPGISTVTVRVETRDPFVVVMELWEERAFYEYDDGFSKYIGFFYGILIAMAVYNLFLYIAIRDRMYAFYVGYLFFFLLMNFTYSGYAFPSFWPEYPELGNWAHSIAIYLYTLSGLAFAMVFLSTKAKLPRVHRALLIYVGIVGAVFLLSSLTGGYAHNVATSILFVVLFSVIAFALGIISWLRGNRTARFYILATTTGLFGAMITAFTVSSILPYSFYTYRAVDLGMILDAMLLSLALADRYKVLERERDRLQFQEEKHKELLKQKEAFAKELEGRVQEELEKNRKQEGIMLKQYQQAALGNMIGVIAHQLKQPLNAIGLYIQNMGESFRHGELTPDEMEKAQAKVWNSVVFMSRTIDDFRNFFRPDKERQSFLLGEAVEKVLGLLDQQAVAQDVRIDIVSTRPIRVTSHENELQQVLLNLLTNAFDVFRERRVENPTVRIELAEEDQNAVIRIEDNGGGIPETALSHMFEIYYTTKGESGTGLGLYMSRMIVTESLGGEITVANGERGARFVIHLPFTKV